MANKVTVNPRYMKYETKDEVEALLEKVENPDTTPTEGSGNLITSGAVARALAESSATAATANEEDVRSLIANYRPAAEEEEPLPDSGSSGSGSSE